MQQVADHHRSLAFATCQKDASWAQQNLAKLLEQSAVAVRWLDFVTAYETMLSKRFVLPLLLLATGELRRCTVQGACHRACSLLQPAAT